MGEQERIGADQKAGAFLLSRYTKRKKTFF